MQVPSGGTRTLEFRLLGFTDPAVDYRLTFAPQPLVHRDDLTVSVEPADGWSVCGVDGFTDDGSGAGVTVEPEEDARWTVEFCPQ